jgi:hypothetical protein
MGPWKIVHQLSSEDLSIRFPLSTGPISLAILRTNRSIFIFFNKLSLKVIALLLKVFDNYVVILYEKKFDFKGPVLYLSLHSNWNAAMPALRMAGPSLVRRRRQKLCAIGTGNLVLPELTVTRRLDGSYPIFITLH